MRPFVSMIECKNTEMDMLIIELKEFQRREITLSINGSKSSPEDIVRAYAVAEKGTYMRDYIDNDGVIRQIDFIYVRTDTK